MATKKGLLFGHVPPQSITCGGLWCDLTIQHEKLELFPSTPRPPPHPSCGQRQEVAGWQDGGDAADFTEKARARGDVGRPFDFSLSWHFSASIVPIIVLLVLWKIKNEWMPKSISKSIQRLTQGQTTFCLRWREEANSAYHRFLIQVAILVDLRFVRSDPTDCSRWFPSIEARLRPLFPAHLLLLLD